MNGKLIQIDGKFYKECEVVILPTKQETILQRDRDYPNKLSIISKQIRNSQDYEGVHLYILSSKEIKGDEWYINFNEDGSPDEPCKSSQKAIDSQSLVGNERKIIATTDESLFLERIGNTGEISGYKGKPINVKDLLPRPSDDFIKAFVEKQGKIDKVLVEYKEMTGEELGSDPAYYPLNERVKLKIAPDNTITIKPVQEKTSWSKEEVITYGKLAFEVGRNYQLTGENNLSEIEENL